MWCRNLLSSDRLDSLAVGHISKELTQLPEKLWECWDQSGHQRIPLAFSTENRLITDYSLNLVLCTESTSILFCVLLSLPLQCKHALVNIPNNIFKIINNEKKAHDKRHVHASYCNASGLANVLFLLCPTVAFDFLTLK